MRRAGKSPGELVAWADVVIVTLRAGRLRAWGLDWEAVHALNPRAILLQISGFGATSSRADAPGFGKMGEARSGVVHLTGFPTARPCTPASRTATPSPG